MVQILLDRIIWVFLPSIVDTFKDLKCYGGGGGDSGFKVTGVVEGSLGVFCCLTFLGLFLDLFAVSR